MPLNTEIFVMCIFIAGIPLYYGLLHDSELPGADFFLLTYLLLFASNVFTVVEEFWFNAFFNGCEHAFITLSAVTMLVAVVKMTARDADRPDAPAPPNPDSRSGP